MAIYRNYQDEASRQFWMDFDRDMGRPGKPEDYQPNVRRTIGKPTEPMASTTKSNTLVVKKSES